MPRDRQVDLVIGATLRRELLRRGFVIVPMAPSHEMQDHAHKAQTGSFSNWALLPLWFQLLSFADPEAKPFLDALMERYRREEGQRRFETRDRARKRAREGGS